jgi:hypothetical protein
MSKIAVVIPNWNGEDSLTNCLDSLKHQEARIIVVDNGSKDSSLQILKKYKDIEVISSTVNKGFAGGVNLGFKFAIDNGYDYVATLNNDAVADKAWVKKLSLCLDNNDSIGIATSKMLSSDKQSIDSTGDYYTVWGLPYPRGRGENNLTKYDAKTYVFAASGGASMYRVDMLKQVGLFDEHFFAYYEDVDLSFRAQLAGWKIKYAPSAVVFHQIGATSTKIKGFTTYQTLKNLPLLLIKNVPGKYFLRVFWRFIIVYKLFFFKAIYRRHMLSAIRGVFMAAVFSPQAWLQRRKIQATRVVPDEYVWSMIVHDLPPNAYSLRKLRSFWWKIRGKSGE